MESPNGIYRSFTSWPTAVAVASASASVLWRATIFNSQQEAFGVARVYRCVPSSQRVLARLGRCEGACPDGSLNRPSRQTAPSLPAVLTARAPKKEARGPLKRRAAAAGARCPPPARQMGGNRVSFEIVNTRGQPYQECISLNPRRTPSLIACCNGAPVSPVLGPGSNVSLAWKAMVRPNFYPSLEAGLPCTCHTYWGRT